MTPPRSGASPASDQQASPGDRASLIGHELQAPLAVIKAAAETADLHHDHLDGEGVRELLRTIVRNADLALSLVRRIGRARDLTEGTFGLAREQVDLTALVTESVADLGHAVLTRHPTYVTGLGSLPVSADPTALREILFNLLVNAAKYSPTGTPIIVTVARGHGGAEVVVRDRGAGVAVEDTDMIFDRYTQADASSPGAGLGLFISRGLARAHDGDLHVRPTADGGSEFVLTLPA